MNSSHTITAEELKELAPKGIIFSGGPHSVMAESALRCDERLFDLGIPILGIGYGMQLMAHYFKGKLEQAASSEEVAPHAYGTATVHVRDSSLLYAGS